MHKITKFSIVTMLVMALLSFTFFIGINIAGSTVIIGIIAFIIDKKLRKQSFAGSGLDFKAIGQNLKERSIWLWIALPLIMNIVCIGLSKLMLPEYFEHVIERSAAVLTYDKIVLLVIQLLVLALGEEIAWRAFYLNRLSKIIPATPALIFSSLLFAICHVQSGDIIIVAYDVLFVFINSLFYGIIFKKTNNACISWISHFIANIFGVVVLVLL